jgi:hypothetical protein
MERITKLEEKLEKKQKEINEIKCSDNDNEYKVDTFERVKSQEAFYNISLDGVTTIFKQFETEQFEDFNNNCFKNNNYFKSIERAAEVKSKIELLLRLERLYDTYCPDYKPNWNDNYEFKYFIEFDCADNIYVSSYTDAYYRTDVYFPSEYIAEKVCDILNAELERNKKNETMS